MPDRPHAASDLSPICLAARAHVDIRAPNFGIREYVEFGTEASNQVFSYDMSVKEGMFHVGDSARPVVGFDADAAAKYPYN
ncbi:hypothetical protein [Tropicimonas aquimaris]|uniref:Uncharacterized protein n=1 Tax=Tropicimonas aquimaris TaxID=914152 RepID=A0ABW3IYL7_9RHOB